MSDPPVRCDVGGLRHPDMVAVDALARLQLTARRCGRSICLVNAAAELIELLELAGLRDVLLAEGQAEQREEVGIEEGVDAGDALT